jgi:hypothetical protein
MLQVYAEIPSYFNSLGGFHELDEKRDKLFYDPGLATEVESHFISLLDQDPMIGLSTSKVITALLNSYVSFVYVCSTCVNHYFFSCFDVLINTLLSRRIIDLH